MIPTISNADSTACCLAFGYLLTVAGERQAFQKKKKNTDKRLTFYETNKGTLLFTGIPTFTYIH